jgi:hypothetical protein
VKLAKLRRPKITCSPSYVDCRPKSNAVIFLAMSQTKVRTHTGRIVKGKETKKFNVVDVLTVEE